MYQEYLAEIWYSTKALENSKVSFSITIGGIYGEVGLNTFRNAIGAHYLPHSSEYVAPPSIDVVRKWFPTIGYGEEVSTKGTLRKSLLPPRWSLANGIHIDYANIFWEDIILKLKKKQKRKVESPHVVSSVKLPILKKVIMNGDEPVQTTKDENGVETKVTPKTAQALLQRQRERKAKSILLLAIPDEYQLRFHGIQDAKTLWAAIKSRFGGNVESKKMQKNVLKQQFENFSVSDTEGLDKAYDRFQKLISLLEVHGAAVSNEDANQKFLRALPSSWNNVALIMRNKTGIDDLDIDDLYNNLKVFEADIKSSSGSSSNSQNVAFLSAEDTNSINEVNTANGVSTASGHNSQGQASSSSYTDDLMFSFFANQSNSPQLDDEDLEQAD
ncbi:hypothetical protein Tco_0269251 [Tanacetum coccineum]